MKPVNYTINIYNENGSITDTISLIDKYISNKHKFLLDNISRSPIFIKNENNQFIRYHKFIPYSYSVFINKYDFDLSSYYVYNENTNEFIHVKDVLWYGLNYNESYILADNEEFVPIRGINPDIINIKDELYIIDFGLGDYYITTQIINKIKVKAKIMDFIDHVNTTYYLTYKKDDIESLKYEVIDTQFIDFKLKYNLKIKFIVYDKYAKEIVYPITDKIEFVDIDNFDMVDIKFNELYMFNSDIILYNKLTNKKYVFTIHTSSPHDFTMQVVLSRYLSIVKNAYCKKFIIYKNKILGAI